MGKKDKKKYEEFLISGHILAAKRQSRNSTNEMEGDAWREHFRRTWHCMAYLVCMVWMDYFPTLYDIFKTVWLALHKSVTYNILDIPFYYKNFHTVSNNEYR